MARIGFAKGSTVDSEVLPAGEYSCIIEKVEAKEWPDGGKFLSLQLKILDGDYQGRCVFDSPTYESMDINSRSLSSGQARLSQICEVMDIDYIEDSDDMQGVSVGVKLIIYTPKDTSKPQRNLVVQYTNPGVQVVSKQNVTEEKPVVNSSDEYTGDNPF